jgi:hypothetical protein
MGMGKTGGSNEYVQGFFHTSAAKICPSIKAGAILPMQNGE